MRKFPFYKQLDLMDCGPACLKMIAEFYGKSYEMDFLRSLANITKSGVSLGGISEAAEHIGFNTLGVLIDFETLKDEVKLPCIIHWRQRHFVVVYKISKKYVFIADPAYGLTKYSIKEFIKAWTEGSVNSVSNEGYLLTLDTTPKFYKNNSQEKRDYGFKFLFFYFRPYKRYIYQLMLGLIIGSLLQLIFPFLTQSVVDYGINYQNISFVYLILIAQLTLFVSRSSVEIIRSWLLLHMTSRININLISDFLMKLMRLPIAYYDSKNTGDIIQRINDHQRVQSFLSSTTLNTIFSFFNLIIFGFVLAYYSLKIFTIFLIGSGIYIGWTLLFMKQRAELDYKTFDQAADNQSNIYQLISGMQEIKLNGSERRRRWEWETIQIKLFKLSIKGLSLSQMQNLGGKFFNEIKNIFITFVAAKAVIEGELTLGMMLSTQYIIGQLNLPISNFITFIQSGQDAKISIKRLAEIHNKEEENKLNQNNSELLPSNKSINIIDGCYRYGGKSSPLVLKNLTLSIPEGKVTAIVGHSGSGKTTLLKMLLKFYELKEGIVKVGDQNLDTINTKIWRRFCGAVMQDGFIFGDTILRNITESNSDEPVNKDRLIQAIKVANLDGFLKKLPSGYNTKIGESGIGISGGEKQRVLIARSVYKNPDYLFFDEATSALDADNEKVIMKNLEEFYKDKTVVIIAHRLSTVKKADQIILLENGEIIERGVHKELISEKGAYYTLVKNQLELGN